MNEVAQKYPLANAQRVQELWKQYQYADQKAYKNFLEYYENMESITEPV